MDSGQGNRGDTSMLIGILSDTHDRLPMIDAAVEKLNEARADLVLHAGDYIAPFVIPRLSAITAEFVGVLGNNDGDPDLLMQRCSEYAHMEIRGAFTEIREDELDIGLLHGSDPVLLQALIRSGAYDVVVHGHTHQAGISRYGKTLVINPGEVCGYLTGTATIALLDTGTAEARLIPL
jgi:putative phosphoesterase